MSIPSPTGAGGNPTRVNQTPADALERFRAALDALDLHPRPEKDGYRSLCPVHAERGASFIVKPGKDRIITKCFGCGATFADVCSALGFPQYVAKYSYTERRPPAIRSASAIARWKAKRAAAVAQLPASEHGDDGGPISSPVAEYEYLDAQGTVVYKVTRHTYLSNGEKTFRAWRREGTGWAPGAAGIPRVLYRLPDVLAVAANAGTVVVVEGEKDADSGNALGLPGVVFTSPAFGANEQWRRSFSESLRGAGRVVIVADRDAHQTGEQKARAIAADLAELGMTAELMQAAEGKDLTDHLAAGHSLDQLQHLTEPTPPESPASAAEVIQLPQQQHDGPEGNPGRRDREWSLSMTQPTAANPVPSGGGGDRSNVRDMFRRTDHGNAQRLVQRHQDQLRYVEDQGLWYVWTGRRWQADPDNAAVMRCTVETIQSLYRAAGDDAETDGRKALAMWAIKSESLPRLKAAVQLAQIDQRIRCRVADLDSDPWLMGVQNGTLDLRTGVVRAPDPADLITHEVATEYDPEATCPLWDRTLERIQPDAEMRAFLARAVGYSLTGLTTEQLMFLAYGRGANGKSVLVEVLMALLGGYAQKAAAELLMARQNGSDLSNDVARIRGARFVATVETDEGRRLAEGRVKELTGDDTVTARFLHKEFFEFKPVAKIWLVTNHRPRITGTDDGIWRRLVTVPFGEYIGPAERDKHLGEKLRAELPGILAWAVRGCLAWQEYGLRAPSPVREAAQDYRAEQDILGAFLDECCVNREAAVTPASSLYREYQSWSGDNGHASVSQTSFGIRLRERGYTKVKGRTVSWRGIALRSNRDDDYEPPPPPAEPEPDPAPPMIDTTPPAEAAGGPDEDTRSRAAEFTTETTASWSDEQLGEALAECWNDAGAVAALMALMDARDAARSSASASSASASSESASSESTSSAPGPVTRRRRRPWSARSTVYVTWSSGRGVTDDGTAVQVPAKARVGAFLAGLPDDAQRVILVGAMPGKTGPGLQQWATDELDDGWSAGAHYLDPDSLAARYVRPDGGRVEIHRLSSWAREDASSVRPEQAAAAFALFRDGLRAIFGRRRVKPGEKPRDDEDLAPAVLASPASTGRELLMRSLPSGHSFPVLEPDHLALIHATTRQGRNQFLIPEHGGPDELPGLYGYDMRWAYAGFCRSVVGSGPAQLHEGAEFLDYTPARYEVEFRVPNGWNHLGLLQDEDRSWPNKPGSRGRSWADRRELQLAHAHGWKLGEDVRILRRLTFNPGPGRSEVRPLRTWAEKLVELRETWLPAQEAPEAVVQLARDFTRTVLLAGIGALFGRRQRVTHALPRERAAEVPDGAEAALAGNMLVWTTEQAAEWSEMVHPEWTAQVWAEQRCRLLDSGQKAAQPNVGALHVSYEQLVALRTDAVYTTGDPGWTDPGGVGQFRRQMAVAGPIETPRSVEALLALRDA